MEFDAEVLIQALNYEKYVQDLESAFLELNKSST